MASDRTEAARRGDVPDDANRGYVNPVPADAEEARADRDMADAERAVAQGAASKEQAALVDKISDARTHEERRRLWLDA